MNYSDSERIASILTKQGYQPAKNEKKADLIVLNACSVRQSAIDRVYGQVHKYYKTKKIILTGCILKEDRKKLAKKANIFWDPSEYFESVPVFESSFSAYVPIMTGCNNFCSYCVVPYARGREVSRPAQEIIEEIKVLIKKGYKEITLLGQNVNSYKDGIINFSGLLKKVNLLPGHFWIRFLTSHPKDMSDELIETIAKCKKVTEYVHLPIQSGNDEILEKMNRKYTAKHYLNLIKKIKDVFGKYKPRTIYALSGDIIVGFPGETRKQFLDSAEIMKRIRYDMIFFGQFSKRPGTAATKMKDNVSKAEKVRREKFLNEILKKTAYINNLQYLGKTLEVLIDKFKNGHYFGKTRTMKNVKLISNQKNLVGKFVKVKITKANIWNLEACLPKRQGTIK